MDLLTGASDTVLVSRLPAYYHRAAGYIDASLDGTPLVYRNFPGGLDGTGHFDVTPFPLTANRLLWATHAKYAVEFDTWAPLSRECGVGSKI